jgi:hypothetical protein
MCHRCKTKDRFRTPIKTLVTALGFEPPTKRKQPMSQLIKFRGTQSSDPDTPNRPTTEDPSAPEIVEQLRHRLLNNPSDSLETKVAIVGEITYQCYKQLAKRRYL